ncbi:MAG: 1-(5-phosphoribosyl)-5-[(5-phosphoribosylamino)methylideneamino]imidazole-4-carboxamide isomerase [Thermoplasmatota archaeon]
MIAIPAIDLRDGMAVQLVGGDLKHEKVRLPDPVGEAVKWQERGAEWLHVVDLDRALARGNNLRIIERILESTTMRVQVGGGVRFFEDIDALLNMGAARVVVGTRAITDSEFLTEAAHRYGKRLVVAVDARGDDIQVKGWTEGSGKSLDDFAKRLSLLGLGGLLYTDVGREGRLAGANVERVGRLVTDAAPTPIIASGGVASTHELVALQQAGAWGCVIGMAFYTGKIQFEDARAKLAEGVGRVPDRGVKGAKPRDG